VTEQAHQIKLSGALGLREVELIREQFLDALTTHAAVEVVTEKLTAIDMSIIQVLIAAQKMAKDRGQSFHVCARAEGLLRSALSRAGLLTRSGIAPFDVRWQGSEAAL
jgi:anti-anti-sigma regulatory factor